MHRGRAGRHPQPQAIDDIHILRDLPRVRREEMARAQAILGVQHTWLGFVDSACPRVTLPPLPDGCFALEPLDVTTEALVREVRRFRPHVMTTYDEAATRGPHHVPHRLDGGVRRRRGPRGIPARRRAVAAAEDLYNQTFSRERIVAFHEALTALEEESPYAEWLEHWQDRTPDGDDQHPLRRLLRPA